MSLGAAKAITLLFRTSLVMHPPHPTPHFTLTLIIDHRSLQHLSSTMASSLARRQVSRISARVFCHMEEGGGNPVTVFSSPSPLSDNTYEKLAKQCEWESVMVEYRKDPNKPLLSFYMPSGEQVSFCAHAAMGAALEICLSTKEEA